MQFRKFGTIIATAALVLVALPGQAAPQLSLTVTKCQIVKESGNKYHLYVEGHYTAANNTDNIYKINGYRFMLRNNGGQQVRDTGYVSIAPTYLFDGGWNEFVSYKFAASLRDVQFWVYNGSSQKGYDSFTCTHQGW